jgi:hypothetical protein
MLRAMRRFWFGPTLTVDDPLDIFIDNENARFVEPPDGFMWHKKRGVR